MKLFDAYQVCVQTIKYMAKIPKKVTKKMLEENPVLAAHGVEVGSPITEAERCDQCTVPGLKNDNELCPKCQGHGFVAKN